MFGQQTSPSLGNSDIPVCGDTRLMFVPLRPKDVHQLAGYSRQVRVCDSKKFHETLLLHVQPDFCNLHLVHCINVVHVRLNGLDVSG